MAMSVTYLTMNGMIVHENRDGVQRDYVPDTLGSTAALVDNTQTITDRWEYWPYGEVSQRTGTNPTPFTFVGMLGYLRDVLDKLLYVRARYLRLDLARWMTVDPLWPNSKVYAYCNNAPNWFVDPSGLRQVGISWQIGLPIGDRVPPTSPPDPFGWIPCTNCACWNEVVYIFCNRCHKNWNPLEDMLGCSDCLNSCDDLAGWYWNACGKGYRLPPHGPANIGSQILGHSANLARLSPHPEEADLVRHGLS